MGFLHDLLLEEKCAQHERDLKDAYGMGFRDGRLCGPDLRPCLVDGKPATFHRWAEEDKALLKIDMFLKFEDQARLARRFWEEDVIGPEGTIEVLRVTFALVEYPDGSVDKVDPKLIQFIAREEE